MRKIWLYILTFAMYVSSVQSIFSQTNGTLTFTLTTNSTGGFSPQHLLAIWIENNNGTFIKTKLKNSMDNNLDHLGIWTAKSANNISDALTGPTLSSHGTISVEWNGTNVSGTLVPDGVYKIWIEMAWADSKTTGKTAASFSFTKGSNTVNIIPASTANFTDMSLNWVPGLPLATEKIPQPESIRVYPNPASDFINLAFSQAATNCRIKILNVTGTKVHEESEDYINPGNKTIDLSKYPNGIYFINVESVNKLSIFRVIKNK